MCNMAGLTHSTLRLLLSRLTWEALTYVRCAMTILLVAAAHVLRSPHPDLYLIISSPHQQSIRRARYPRIIPTIGLASIALLELRGFIVQIIGNTCSSPVVLARDLTRVLHEPTLLDRIRVAG